MSSRGSGESLLVVGGVAWLAYWAWRRFFTASAGQAAMVPTGGSTAATSFSTSFTVVGPSGVASEQLKDGSGAVAAFKWPFSSSTLLRSPPIGAPSYRSDKPFSSRTATPEKMRLMDSGPDAEQAKFAAELAAARVAVLPFSQSDQDKLMALKRAYAAERLGQCT